MPINLPNRMNNQGPQKGPPVSLAADILDGLAVAFCILIITWAMQHVVFDYLANPDRPTLLSPAHT
jgi:hypothetical protein